jgi:protoporphyrinogen/coproporphyrinogen III oxidase
VELGSVAGSSPPRTLVVGAGPGGLAAATALARADLPLTVLEAQDRAGGWCRTRRVEGYSFEVGPQTWRAPIGSPLEQVIRWAGLEAEVRPPRDVAKRRFVLRKGALHAVPRALPSLLGPRPLLRFLCEAIRPGRPRPRETVGAFLRRRFGPGITPFGDAFVSGVFAGDPERLELASAFPSLARAEEVFGSVIRAARSGGFPPREIAGLRGGLGTLSEALAEDLGPLLRCGQRVHGLLPSSLRKSAGDVLPWQAFAGEARFEAERLVLGLPAYAAAELLAPHDPHLGGLLRGIPYADVAVVSLGFDAGAFPEGPPEGFGFLVPRSEGRRILGCIYASSLFADLAPAGKVSLRVLLGGARDPGAVDLSEAELLETALRELGQILGLKPTPEVHDVLRLRRAIPQYLPGHAARVQAIEEALRQHPGLVLVGNAYRGVSLPDTIADALSQVAPLLSARAPVAS